PRQKKEMQTNLDRFRVIMDSMTADEKNEPTLLKQERIRRVARGSGSTEKEVRALLAQWNKSRKMMKGMRGDRQMRKKMKEMMGSLDDSEFQM
ncbi:MAG: signal recognition particle protein Srp19, partial [Candidatus Poseidoniales archaeon]|nr:signal recognition particle protein Srp19 [Candidatus Poseidoniales archaeon]